MLENFHPTVLYLGEMSVVVVHHGFQFDNYPISPTLLQRLGNKQQIFEKYLMFLSFLHFSFLALTHSLIA